MENLLRPKIFQPPAYVTVFSLRHLTLNRKCWDFVHPPLESYWDLPNSHISAFIGDHSSGDLNNISSGVIDSSQVSKWESSDSSLFSKGDVNLLRLKIKHIWPHYMVLTTPLLSKKHYVPAPPPLSDQSAYPIQTILKNLSPFINLRTPFIWFFVPTPL